MKELPQDATVYLKHRALLSRVRCIGTDTCPVKVAECQRSYFKRAVAGPLSDGLFEPPTASGMPQAFVPSASGMPFVLLDSLYIARKYGGKGLHSFYLQELLTAYLAVRSITKLSALE